MTNRAHILAAIEDVVAGRLAADQLEQAIYLRYFDAPEGEFTDAEHDFFGAICERLDYTSSVPDAQSRAVGHGDHADFLAWLRQANSEYKRGSFSSYNRDHEQPGR